MAVTAEHLIVIGRGRLVADCSTEEFIERGKKQTVLVRTPDAARLTEAIALEGGEVTKNGTGELSVANMDAARIGEIAAAGGYVLHEVVPQRGSLEEAFLELTRDSVEYRAAGDAAVLETQGGAK